MCKVDWMAVAAMIGALSTLGLLLSAIYGFRVWRDQFFKSRDHDFAVKLIGTVENSYRVLDGLRAPTALLYDGDVQIARSSYENEQQDWDYRRMSARYLSRQRHLASVADKRIDAVHEALLIWDGCGQELQDLADRLSEKERQVLVEAKKYVDNLHPNTEEEESVDMNILYYPFDRNAEDPTAGDSFATEYYDIGKQIQNLVMPKISMEKKRR